MRFIITFVILVAVYAVAALPETSSAPADLISTDNAEQTAQVISLSDVDDAGAAHANEAERNARLIFYGGYRPYGYGGYGYGYRPYGYGYGYRPYGYGYGYRPYGYGHGHGYGRGYGRRYWG